MRVSLKVMCIAGLVAVAIVGGCGQKKEPPAPAAMTPMQPPPPAAVTPTTPKPTPAVSGKELGKIIFTTGNGSAGTHIEFEKGGTQFKAKPGGCVGCHGADAKGKKVGNLTVPDIRASTLLEAHGGKPAKYTSATLKKAVTQGIDEEGKPLKDAMPRWKMTDDEFGALAEFVTSATGAPATKAPAPGKAKAKAPAKSSGY